MLSISLHSLYGLLTYRVADSGGAWLEASGRVLRIRCVHALLLLLRLITRLLTKFCNHGLAAFYGSSSSRVHSVSRACSSPLLASVVELVAIMLLAGSTGGPCAVWLQK